MIHLIVGNTGAGKTTYSAQLKQKTKGIIFSIDKWNKTLFFADRKTGDGLEWFLERITRAEEMIMDLVQQLENAGTDAILDLGFSLYDHREKFRKFAAKNGYEIQIHFLDISTATRYSRLIQRNTEKGPSFEFEVSKEDFEFMEGYFERPTEKELEEGIIITE